MPNFLVPKTLKPFVQLGKLLSEKQEFELKIIKKLAKSYQYNKFQIYMLQFFLLKFYNNYWIKKLKINNAFEKRLKSNKKELSKEKVLFLEKFQSKSTNIH